MTNSQQGHTLDLQRIRADFPVLDVEVQPGVKLVYLDSGATSQKPVQVIERMNQYYRAENANIHRGVHKLAEQATEDYEAVRGKLAKFINAAKSKEIVFTRNATESVNLVAQTWGRANLQAGDVVVLTEMEHHANLVPWQMLAAERGIRLEFIPVTEEGVLDMNALPALMELKPKLVSFTAMSNVLGTITPIAEIVQAAHAAGALAMVDGAQSVPHLPTDVRALDIDFLVFSSHKMLGPTGIGVLYGKEAILEGMPPFMGGGDMIKRVKLREFTTAGVPHKFEAGTPAIAEVIGLGAAVDYLTEIGMEAIAAHDRELTAYALERLEEVPGIWIFGPGIEHKSSNASFTLKGAHPHDVAEILNRSGVATRAGHHCAMPVHEKFGVPATTRASFYLYNTTEEIDTLVEALYKVKEIFK
ncbi:MAG TPA: cysteine desulfurase [Anaerolineales bacterium]|nr:cysteine desulfurase [Anaerolineales bacterium]HRQ92865.1 cysteine desulfurase [Anaerolineales bacterium]